ncbi:MAG TPA: T9SS type A sorting domain-containing protein [Bacteroidota bacterium]|nr:T9SS type A sorting domain-containing protein [Bacteroidota bacterium]
MKIAAVILFAMMAMPVLLFSQTAIAPSAGDGSSGNPYQIATLENLYWISQNPGEWNKYYIQTANIDASPTSGWDSTGWTPIGAGSGFGGTYDGNGHSINDLYINRPSGTIVALFAEVIDGGIVKQLGVTNVNVTGYYYVGGLVGLNLGVVENCYSSGNVSGSYAWIGGLIGGNDMTGITRYSYSHTNAAGGECVGSLTGENYHGGTIQDSYAMGNVTGTASVGGLSGTNYQGTISNSYSTGISSGYGLIGYGGGTCTNSFWDTLTSGKTTSNGGTGESTSDMKTLSTFADSGWDFTSVWEMVGENYPQLRTNPDSVFTGVKERAEMPKLFMLDQNYPNPFNPSTVINYSIPSTGFVSLRVYDVLGREVAVLVNEKTIAGSHQAVWNASDSPSGIYFCTIAVTGTSDPSRTFTQVRRMVLIK